jgi:hypothetical protein
LGGGYHRPTFGSHHPDTTEGAAVIVDPDDSPAEAMVPDSGFISFIHKRIDAAQQGRVVILDKVGHIDNNGASRSFQSYPGEVPGGVAGWITGNSGTTFLIL